MNVIVVILDSLRPDHVGAYGAERTRTPNLDALAKDSMRFTRPYPESIPTLCARRAVYTGKRTWPFRGWEPPRGEPFSPAGWQKIPEDQLSLTTLLAGAGYRTAFVTDTFHQFKPSYNFQRGFESFDYVRGQAVDYYHLTSLVTEAEINRNTVPGNSQEARLRVRQHLANTADRQTERGYFAPQVFSRAMERLGAVSEGGAPFFMVVDCFDPHEPWDPPEPYSSMYGEPIGDRGEPIMPNAGPSDYLTERGLDRMRELYAGEVTLVDRWFGEFVNRMQDLGLLEDTLLITLSDHGVALGEHGYTSKVPQALWPEITDIVYYVRHPEGKGAGRTSDFYASTHDVAPTILATLESLDAGSLDNLKSGESAESLSRMRRQMDGQDLNPILEGGAPAEERNHFTLGYDNYSWARDERYVMFCFNDGTQAKLYDVRGDPEMENNIAGGNPGVVRRMYDEYIVADAGGRPPPIK